MTILTEYDVAVLLTEYNVAVLLTEYNVAVLLTGYDVAEAVLALVGRFTRLETVVGELGVLQRLQHTQYVTASSNQQLTCKIPSVYCTVEVISFYAIHIHS